MQTLVVFQVFLGNEGVKMMGSAQRISVRCPTLCVRQRCKRRDEQRWKEGGDELVSLMREWTGGRAMNRLKGRDEGAFICV